MMKENELPRFRQILEQQRDDINRRINQDQARAREQVGGVADVAEVSAQMINTDTALSMGERWTYQFNEIERALARIERGEFGRCQECGDDIQLKRLEAVPTAVNCAACATAAEENAPATL